MFFGYLNAVEGKSLEDYTNKLNSLPAIAIDAHERQVFEKLLWGLVSSMIFFCC
jgi:hypothetical protein